MVRKNLHVVSVIQGFWCGLLDVIFSTSHKECEGQSCGMPRSWRCLCSDWGCYTYIWFNGMPAASLLRETTRSAYRLLLASLTISKILRSFSIEHKWFPFIRQQTYLNGADSNLLHSLIERLYEHVRESKIRGWTTNMFGLKDFTRNDFPLSSSNSYPLVQWCGTRWILI